MSKQRSWRDGPMWYKVDAKDPRILHLRNGTQIRQSIVGVPIYVSQGARVYTLTSYGLRARRINFVKCKKYLTKTKSGNRRGQRYPFILYGNSKKYEIHVLVTLAWDRTREEGEEIDHIDGNIDDCRLINLRVISAEENDRCAGILRRLRRIAKSREDPILDPRNIKQADLIEIFERLRGKDLDVFVPKEIERYRVLATLRHAAEQLRDPQTNPDNMDAERREMVLYKYRIEDPEKIMEEDFKQYREF